MTTEHDQRECVRVPLKVHLFTSTVVLGGVGTLGLSEGRALELAEPYVYERVLIPVGIGVGIVHIRTMPVWYTHSRHSNT